MADEKGRRQKYVLLGLCIRGKRQEQDVSFESPYKKLEKQEKTTKFMENMYVFDFLSLSSCWLVRRRMRDARHYLFNIFLNMLYKN